MLGHTLRGVDRRTLGSPAYLSVLFAKFNAETDTNFRGRRGRPSLNLLDMIRNDLKRKNISNSLRLISDFKT